MNKFFPPPASSWLHLIKRGARMSPLSARDVRYLARSPACKQGLCTHVPLLLHDATPDISHLLLVSPSRCRKTLQFRRLFFFPSFFSLSSSFFFFFCYDLVALPPGHELPPRTEEDWRGKSMSWWKAVAFGLIRVCLFRNLDCLNSKLGITLVDL